MKPFFFRLEAVLNMRAREEAQARENFALALKQRAEAQCDLNLGRAEMDSSQKAIATLRSQPSSGSEQLMLIRAWRWTSEACQRMERIVAAAEQVVETRRLEFVAARQRHEAIAKLKEKQRLEHATGVRREEEAQVQDFITARFGRDATMAA